jgi:hypothetical protein
MEFAGRLSRKFKHAQQCSKVYFLTLNETTEFVTNKNMVIVPQPPYSLFLASFSLTFFPKLKMKLKGQRFGTVPGIQRESQAVLDSIKVNDFHGTYEAWEI